MVVVVKGHFPPGVTCDERQGKSVGVVPAHYVESLIEAVRAGEGLALVVRGEPGVGKTALLDYMVERAAGCRVAQAAGVQSEMELAFASLHQLCTPMLDRLERLPVRSAMRGGRPAFSTTFRTVEKDTAHRCARSGSWRWSLSPCSPNQQAARTRTASPCRRRNRPKPSRSCRRSPPRSRGSPAYSWE